MKGAIGVAVGVGETTGVTDTGGGLGVSIITVLLVVRMFVGEILTVGGFSVEVSIVEVCEGVDIGDENEDGVEVGSGVNVGVCVGVKVGEGEGIVGVNGGSSPIVLIKRSRSCKESSGLGSLTSNRARSNRVEGFSLFKRIASS